MPILLKPTLLAGAVLLACASLCAAPAAMANTTKPVKAKVKAAPKAPAEPNPEADEPDVKGSVTTDFNCEMGNKVTVYTNEGDENHIALRWKKRVHRLSRIDTTTGAHRFENNMYGLVWIGIPAKGMLLDSKHNHQLANECKSAEQEKPVVATAPETSKG